MQNTQIIILAGGLGTRMNSGKPKSLTLLRGKPFLGYILDVVDSLKMPIPPVIVVGHRKEEVINAFGPKRRYAEQAEPLGTGQAVASAKDKVHPGGTITLVLSSDQPLLSKKTIERLLLAHHKNKSTVTMATVTVPDFEEWRKGLRHFGRIIRDSNGKMEAILEFKEASENEKLIKELNPAVYAFDSEWLWQNIGLLQNNNAKNEYYLTDMVKIAREQGKKIETAPLASLIEACQPNTMEEVVALEKLLAKSNV